MRKLLWYQRQLLREILWSQRQLVLVGGRARGRARSARVVQHPPQLANLALNIDAEELANGAVPLLRVRLDLEQYQLGTGAPEG